MKKAVVLGLILAGSLSAQAVQLSLSETFGASYLLGEDNSGHIGPGLMISQSLVFDFDNALALDVSYFGGTRVTANAGAMEDAAVEQERAAMNSWLEGRTLTSGKITAADLKRFEAFTANIIWGGATLRYAFGDREKRSGYLGLGANYFSVPRVDYTYAFNNIEVTYEEGGTEVEDVYSPEALSRGNLNVDSVQERAGVGALVSLGMNWKVASSLAVHASATYNHGINEDLSLILGGLGISLFLP